MVRSSPKKSTISQTIRFSVEFKDRDIQIRFIQVPGYPLFCGCLPRILHWRSTRCHQQLLPPVIYYCHLRQAGRPVVHSKAYWSLLPGGHWLSKRSGAGPSGRRSLLQDLHSNISRIRMSSSSTPIFIDHIDYINGFRVFAIAPDVGKYAVYGPSLSLPRHNPGHQPAHTVLFIALEVTALLILSLAGSRTIELGYCIAF